MKLLECPKCGELSIIRTEIKKFKELICIENNVKVSMPLPNENTEIHYTCSNCGHEPGTYEEFIVEYPN